MIASLFLLLFIAEANGGSGSISVGGTGAANITAPTSVGSGSGTLGVGGTATGGAIAPGSVTGSGTGTLFDTGSGSASASPPAGTTGSGSGALLDAGSGSANVNAPPGTTGGGSGAQTIGGTGGGVSELPGPNDYRPSLARTRVAQGGGPDWLVARSPGSALDYPIRYALDEGDAITASDWSIAPSEAGGMTVVDGTEQMEDDMVACIVTGGVLGRVYVLTNHATTAAGRTFEEEIVFRVVPVDVA